MKAPYDSCKNHISVWKLQASKDCYYVSITPFIISSYCYNCTKQRFILRMNILSEKAAKEFGLTFLLN